MLKNMIGIILDVDYEESQILVEVRLGFATEIYLFIVM